MNERCAWREGVAKLPKPLRIGVIGLGWVSLNCHLPSIRRLKLGGYPIAEVVLCDRISTLNQRARTILPEAVFVDDPHVLMRRSDIDGILILTRAESAPELLRHAITCGKTTFVEKPVANTIPEIEALADLASKHRVQVQVGYNRRHQPFGAGYLKMLRSMGEGVHVKVKFWRAQRSEANFFDDTLVHCLDFLSLQLGRLCVSGVRAWEALPGIGAIDQGLRVDLHAIDNPRMTAEIDIRPSVGLDIERYTAVAYGHSISLLYPHLAALDGEAGLSDFRGGKEYVLNQVRLSAGDVDARCHYSGFVAQMEEFLGLCGARFERPSCGLSDAIDAIRLREEVARQLKNRHAA